MLGTLLDLCAVGIIGLVSWIWISNYKGGGPSAGGDASAKGSETTASGKPSRSGVAPPPVPKRTDAQIAQSAKEAKARDAAAAKESKEKEAAAAKQSAAAAKEAAKAEELAAKEAAKLAVAEERARLQREKEAEQREKDAAEKKAAKSANLLSMAMQQAPQLPKRPMINILHAPTLTQSIAFSPSPSPESSANSAASSSSSSSAAAAASPAPADGSSLSEEKALKLAEHRKQVAWEIISSEEKYIASLHTLMVCYFNPLKQKSEKGSDKIKPAQHALLFSNVEALWKFHVMMLPSLKTAPDGDVAQVIEQHAPYLKMYTKYVADYTPAMQTVNALSKNEGFVKFLKKQRQQSEGMDLMSFLIMPVQRIPRYVLLLKELQKYTPASHPHHSSIDAAISKLSAIASFINETQRSQENASLLLEFQNLIHELPPEIQLFQPHRKLVRHGLLKLIKQEGTTSYAKLGEELQTSVNPSYMCILFNDMILYTTPNWDYRGQLKLQGAKLNTDGVRLEILKEKSASYRVQSLLRVECPSEEEAAKWSASITESIGAANDLDQQDERRRSAAFNSYSVLK